MMFESLMKIIYVPNILKAEDIIFDGLQFRAKNQLNCVIKYGNLKYYERGEDEDRIKHEYIVNDELKTIKRWKRDSLNRVRIEKTLKGREIHKLSIDHYVF